MMPEDYAACCDTTARQYEALAVNRTKQVKNMGIKLYMCNLETGETVEMAPMPAADMSLFRAHSPRDLLLFYGEWLYWLYSGAPDDNACFSRSKGLCGNVNAWCAKRYTHIDPKTVLYAMQKQFSVAGLSPITPFNVSFDDYRREVKGGSAYLNAARMAWVRARVGDMKPEWLATLPEDLPK